MFEITFLGLFIFITIVFLAAGAFEFFKNREKFALRALKIFLVYLCIIVIFRIVYFPWHHVNGKIDTLKFDKSKITPLWINLVPFVELKYRYDGWLANIVGNITMFIPVGICWPFCFKKLNKLWKAILAGAGFPLFIELTQILFYERCTDIDDFLMNTTGFIIGALIYFILHSIILYNNKNI